MTHSVESRFIAMISGALLVVVAPLFTLFLALSSQQASENLSAHVDVVLATNSLALGKPLWDLDVESIHQVASTLVTDPAIRGVQIADNTGKLNVSSGSVLSEETSDLASITKGITYKSQQGERDVRQDHRSTFPYRAGSPPFTRPNSPSSRSLSSPS